MHKHQKATQRILKTFPKTYKLDPQTRVLHLIEESVELGTSVSKYVGKFPIKLKKGEIEEGFGGLLFDIFVLATQLGINLEEIYPKELEKFKKFSK